MVTVRIVIAPDSFKGTATAREVADNLAAGWHSARPRDELVLAPMADGGEGTLDAFEAAVPGARRIPLTVDGPDGRPHPASWLCLPDKTAVVELACTSGITLLNTVQPLTAHAFGFGQAIAHALDSGAHRLVLALGGSASSDGGASVLSALGARLHDASGRPIPPGNAGLAELASIDLSSLRPLPAGGATILADVVSPLLGPHGAIAVFGAQKGMSCSDSPAAESRLSRWATLLGADPNEPGAGAAGGVGYAMLAWGAHFRSGAAAVGEVIGIDTSIARADFVITGEGCFDEQSNQGKAPSYIRDRGEAHGVPVALVAGTIAAAPVGFATAISLTTLAGSSDHARRDTARWVRAAGVELARSV
ncbi:MAG: glycerate kinase [Microbacteriaceae bacterium]